LSTVLLRSSHAENKRRAVQRLAFKAALAGEGAVLCVGDEVTWKSCDADLPNGIVGQVLFVHPAGHRPSPAGPDVEVLFHVASSGGGRPEPRSFTFGLNRLERVGGPRGNPLAQQLGGGDEDDVEQLVERPGSARPSPLTLLSNSIGLTQPHLEAAKRGDVAAFAVAATAANVNAKDLRGDAALSCAAAKNHLAIVDACLALGAHVDTRGRDNWTALHRAAKKGHAGACYRLVKGGASVNVAGSFGFTALHLACLGNHAAVVLLLAEAPNVNLNLPNLYGNTPLHCAAARGFGDLCRLLVAKGASVAAQNAQGKTAASLARAGGFAVWKDLRASAARDRELWRRAAHADAVGAAPEAEAEAARLASGAPPRRTRTAPQRRTLEVAPAATPTREGGASVDTWLFAAVPSAAAHAANELSSQLRRTPPLASFDRYEEGDDEDSEKRDEETRGSEKGDEAESDGSEGEDEEESESEAENESEDNGTCQVSSSNSDSSFEEVEQL
jgi:ankyrin repeat protein